MYKICRTQESQKRQSRIEQELLHMMGTQPYEDITVRALCAHAEIPRKAFYRYFDSKDDALYALIDHTQQQCLYANPTPGGDIFNELESMLTYWYDNREFLNAIVKNHMEKLWFFRTVDLALKEQAGKEYVWQAENGFQYNLITIFTVTGIMSCILYAHKAGWTHTPQELAHIINTFLTSPMYRV